MTSMSCRVACVVLAIPLALITGWPYEASIAVIGVLTVVYTYFGGSYIEVKPPEGTEK